MIVFWSDPAIEDLRAIRDYIALGSEHFAAEFIEQLLDVVAKLEQFPELGRIVPEVQDPKARELVFQNYRILYRLKPDRLEIAAVIHGRQDVRRKTPPWEIL
jgi:toxin ParE1/3/4